MEKAPYSGLGKSQRKQPKMAVFLGLATRGAITAHWHGRAESRGSWRQRGEPPRTWGCGVSEEAMQPLLSVASWGEESL